LAEEIRQAKGKHYLQENNISIIEVAYLLRFSELSAFVAHLNVGRESLPPNLEQTLIQNSVSITRPKLPINEHHTIHLTLIYTHLQLHRVSFSS